MYISSLNKHPILLFYTLAVVFMHNSLRRRAAWGFKGLTPVELMLYN